MPTIGVARAYGIDGSEKKISRDLLQADGPGFQPARDLAKARASAPRDARTLGLGRSCKTNASCIGRAQICLKEQDANGKELAQGICALPCAPIDAGMADPMAPSAENVAAAKRPPPPRCPKKFQCRSAGAGVPIDLCTQE